MGRFSFLRPDFPTLYIYNGCSHPLCIAAQAGIRNTKKRVVSQSGKKICDPGAAGSDIQPGGLARLGQSQDCQCAGADWVRLSLRINHLYKYPECKERDPLDERYPGSIRIDAEFHTGSRVRSRGSHTGRIHKCISRSAYYPGQAAGRNL